MPKNKLVNYTTQISAAKTISEMEELLGDYGVSEINKIYDSETKMPIGLKFLIIIDSKRIYIKIPADWRPALEVLKKFKIPSSFKTKEHAIKVAWRVAHHWLKSQLAILQFNTVEFNQVFMAYMLLDKERTMYDLFKENSSKLLTSGGQ